MSETKKVYWKGLEQLKNDAAFVKNANHEFPAPEEAPDPGHSRRDFLKMMGFGVSAATLAACEAPTRYAIPYVNKPIDVDPSVANYYASSYINGGDYCSIVVKTREGRPIKIEGNTLSNVTKGGTSAQVEASVLSLYDNYRLRNPKIGADATTWEELDKQIIAKLNEVAGAGQIRIISNTVLSPSTKAAIEIFKTKYPTTQHVQYDPNSAYGIWKANADSFGAGFIPSYDFSKAKTIVSIAADFLGTWIAPIEFTKQYATTRELGDDKKDMSRHYQFESNLSLTGANADYRTMIRPSQEGLVVAQLFNLIGAKVGKSVGAGIEKIQYLEKAAEELWANKGASLVVAGSNDKAVQLLVNGINDMLGNYGTTILPGNPVNYRQGNDEAMAAVVDEIISGKIGAVIFYNCNPVYDYATGAALGAALKNVSLTVSTSNTEDETSLSCQYRAIDHHYLESWNDAEPKKGSYSLSQPAITPIFNSRQAQSSFLAWAGEANTDYFNFVKTNWNNWFFKNSGSGNAQLFWDKCLYDGVYEVSGGESSALVFNGDVGAASSAITENFKPNNAGFELAVYESYGVGTGSQANNPLLHELPDPITKVVWDHPLTISVQDAAKLGITNDGESNTQLATLTVGKNTVEVPVLIQPGQAPGTFGISIGYGRKSVGKVGDSVQGVNAYPFIGMTNGSINFNVTSGVDLKQTGKEFQLAQTQTHNTYMARTNVVQESVLSEYIKNPKAGRDEPKVSKWDEKVDPSTLSLWKGHDYNNHHWGMAIDLNSCTGCGACVVACNVENNVALVGKDEVIRRREMHWLRIDRYYSSDANVEDLRGLEKAAENPEVVFQPMLCQHCNNAPCETVCPVAATTHSTEGVNQMTYNRCIGTRYCANNCPYKVRRFNWFKYHDNQKFYEANPAMNTDLGRMVLNPDVTVRSRGVMEKCSFCVQRIQAGKLTAKKEKRSLQDGEVVTACQTACSSGAILFGDMNNAESKISKLLKIERDEKRPNGIDKKIGNPRAYRVLEEIGVKPNIFYLTKIKNKDKQAEKA
jgi:molybdopterin-containing oxidoreductase family iron-sulfur binding subunit